MIEPTQQQWLEIVSRNELLQVELMQARAAYTQLRCWIEQMYMDMRGRVVPTALKSDIEAALRFLETYPTA